MSSSHKYNVTRQFIDFVVDYVWLIFYFLLILAIILLCVLIIFKGC